MEALVVAALLGLVAPALLGLIPAVIASKKGRSFALWWLYGAALFIAALPIAIMMKPTQSSAAPNGWPPSQEKPDKQVLGWLFINMALIGVAYFIYSQAVSDGALVAAIAQAESLAKCAGRVSLLVLVTAGLLALSLAILAVYLRHQYKAWNTLAPASASHGNNADATPLRRRASFYLWATRTLVVAALLSLLFALVQFVVFLWPCIPRPQPW
jgi:hypothetical protein